MNQFTLEDFDALRTEKGFGETGMETKQYSLGGGVKIKLRKNLKTPGEIKIRICKRKRNRKRRKKNNSNESEKKPNEKYHNRKKWKRR